MAWGRADAGLHTNDPTVLLEVVAATGGGKLLSPEQTALPLDLRIAHSLRIWVLASEQPWVQIPPHDAVAMWLGGGSYALLGLHPCCPDVDAPVPHQGVIRMR